MPVLWFVAGLAIGIALTGLCAIGSFDRGADSVRRGTWSLELAARQRAVIASHSRADALEVRRNYRRALIDQIDRVRRGIIRRVTTRDQQEPGLVLAAEVSSGVA
jgi:hypothetical protein